LLEKLLEAAFSANYKDGKLLDALRRYFFGAFAFFSVFVAFFFLYR
jgi:hypothetical protein